MEFRGATQSQAFETIAERIRENTEAVLSDVAARQVGAREAALALATRRVKQAMGYRRFSIF